MKKYIPILMVFVFLLGFNLARAEVIINEVQIAGSTANDEFIELYNSSSSEVDLTGFYIKKKTSTGSESNFVVSSRFEGVSISGGDYLLIARENEYTDSVSADMFWPSSYSLANNNSLVLYRGSEGDVDEVSWSEIGENKSYQKVSNNWVTATPTPGVENENSSNNDNETSHTQDTNNNTVSANKSSSTTNSEIQIFPIKTHILTNSTAFVGLPTVFKPSATGKSGESIVHGRLFWNFGDGSSLEEINFEPITHTYLYPGEYVVTLEFYRSSNSKIPDATDQFTVKVLSADVVISKVGDYTDFFIELTNNTSQNINISGWALNSFYKNFVFPKNTILASKNKITVSSKITGFTIADKPTLKLMTSQGGVAFDYGAQVLTPSQRVARADKLISKPSAPSASFSLNGGQPIESSLEQITPEEITASAVNSKEGYDYIWVSVFILLVTGSSVAVWFVRRNSRISPSSGNGSGFEMIDE